MRTKPTDVNSLMVTVADDGTASITGINYTDLSILLTAAALHRQQEQFKADPLNGEFDELTHQSNLHAAAWHLHAKYIVDILSTKLSNAVSPNYARDECSGITKMYDIDQRSLEDRVRGAEQVAKRVPSDRSAARPDPLTEAMELLARTTKDIAAKIDEANAAMNAIHARSRKA